MTTSIVSMLARRLRVAAAIGLTGLCACAGGAPPETAAAPSRGMRLVAQSDPDLLEISLAAARDLVSPGEEVWFGGVFAGGREVRAVTDSVVRVYGFKRAPSDGAGGTRVPFVVARTGSGGSAAIPATANLPGGTSASFTTIRVAGDSAYVGGGRTNIREGPGRGQHSCITLVREGTKWLIVRRMPVTNADQCGK